MSLDSRVVTLFPTLLLIIFVVFSQMGPGGLEWSVIVLLVVVQAFWAGMRLGGWMLDAISEAVGK